MNVECGNEVDDTDSSHMIRDKKKRQPTYCQKEYEWSECGKMVWSVGVEWIIQIPLS